jgi:hypothetical protein
MTHNRWAAWGLETYPPLAPPWSHLLGRGRMAVARYDLEATTHERLSEHWHVDTTAATGLGHTSLQRGDVVVWVGRDDEDDTDLVWAPSLVVRAGARRQGRQRVSTLTFTDHRALLLADLPDHLVEAVGLGGIVPSPVRRAVLDLWSLDVLCPECGDLGVPIVWGLPMPSDYTDPPAPREPHDRGPACVLGGCVVSDELHYCPRCEHRWPTWQETRA